MTKQVFWTKRILDTFIEEGNLNTRQEYIMRTRAAGNSIVEQAENLHLSVEQINKEIKKLKILYDFVQKTNDILPPRKNNSKDLLK